MVVTSELTSEWQSEGLLGQRLLAVDAISESDLRKALDIQNSVGGLLGSILIRVGALSEDILLKVLSEQSGQRIVGQGVDLPELHELFVAMDESKIVFDWYLDHSLIHWSDDNKVFYCCKQRTPFIEDTLRYFFPEEEREFCLIAGQEMDTVLDFIKKEKSVDELISDSGSSKALRELAEEAPVVELVNNILAQAVNTDSSDVHIEPDEEGFAVRLRTDGVLYTRFRQPAERFPAVASRIKLISGLDIAERRLPQDGRITTRISGSEMDIRVSTVPGVHGESIVMRLLPKEREVVRLHALGLESDHLELVEQAVREANGMFLVTGPTGSGKSTTLSGALAAANDGRKKIITVEDPVEFVVPGVTQIQAHAEIGYTFAKALRAILRQDPDVIMVGEIRDQETADIAIQSALTGHMVLSTVHTNDALSVFTRLIDMGVEPFLVAAPMKLVQAQRLVRKLCEHCAEPAQVSDQIANELAGLNIEVDPQWKRAVGCEQCLNVGYRGRTGIYEIYPISPAMRDLVVSKATNSEIKRLAEDEGHRTMYQDGLIKAARGVTTVEEVIRVTSGLEI
ncbi:MAG: Flp pilus assembly complex ATPase component TadA [Pseudomonadales bacterium]|nr:Flp pilus assembly complex ATPase component TadA [Pseudomonadales bacterium]MBO7006554.1 Flp pilus assembly complex ATPase component TadA [Pseudomonadales bacterium]